MSDETNYKSGFIYVLHGKGHEPNLFKVGKTVRHPKHRADELFRGNTGVPGPFEVVYKREFLNCHKAEDEIHRRLKEYRFRWDREFFEVPLEEIKKVIEQIAGGKPVSWSISQPVQYEKEEIKKRLWRQELGYKGPPSLFWFIPSMMICGALIALLTMLLLVLALFPLSLIFPVLTTKQSDPLFWILFVIVAPLVGRFLYKKITY